MSRVYNFSAGPAVLPEAVLKEVADEMMDYQGSWNVRHGDEPSEAQSFRKSLMMQSRISEI